MKLSIIVMNHDFVHLIFQKSVYFYEEASYLHCECEKCPSMCKL